MKKWDLQIELKSDFCTATGESAPGKINCKTALEYGIPYIPARRLKGCLLEAGREMADHGIVDETLLDQLFGRPGQTEGEGLEIADARLDSVPGYLLGEGREERLMVFDYEQLQMVIKQYSDLDELHLESIFTRIRTRTALDKTGGAKAHSLRTMQVVPAGIIFTSQLEGNLNRQQEQVLINCVKSLRHMGIGISRGMGEVRCTLRPAEPKVADAECPDTTWLANLSLEEEVCLVYEIQLDLPVVISQGADACGSRIPGSAVLGALAGMYIKKHDLGKRAHEDEDFYRIFLRDGVQFGDAFFKQDDRTYVPCPKALAAAKEDETKWFNILDDNTNRRRRKIAAQISLEAGKLYTAYPQKEIHFHHARPADRGIGHALNDRAWDTSSPTGQFFQYVALSKGQTFAGTWKGRADDMVRLLACLEQQHYRFKLGKSRTAEYGSCHIKSLKPSQAEPNKGAVERGKEWFVWLLTPLVFPPVREASGENGYEQQLQRLLAEVGCEEVTLVCDNAIFDGYNSRWRLPALAYPALAAGSTFYIRTTREIEAREIEDKRWGVVTGKGCGQVKAQPWSDTLTGDIIPGSVSTDDQGVQEWSDGNNALFEALLEDRTRFLESEDVIRTSLDTIDQQEGRQPSLSEITLLLQLLPANDMEAYKELEKAVQGIEKAEKRKRIEKFIKPCSDKSLLFIKKYLEVAKWAARGAAEYE